MDINIEKLIRVVKKYRALYDTNTKEYYDRSKKKLCWEEICSIVHPNWDDTDDNERLLYGKEVQKKWQSLRDCFRRELVLQKHPPASNMKKKTKYKYFDDLEFLTQFTTSVLAESSEQDGGSSTTEFEAKDPLENTKTERKRKRSSSESIEEEFFKEVNNPIAVSKGYADDDVAFLMSLLPGFKQYSLEQKYLLRIELMRTMLKFKGSQNQNTMVVSVKCEADDDDVEVDYGFSG